MKTRDITLIPLFTALIIIGAFARIPLPVCPITFQPVFCLLAGVILGPKKGAAAVGLYILLGLVGLPVFTGGGGVGYVLRPTFGYIIGFAMGAFAAGAVVRSGAPALPRFLAAFGIGLIIIYAVGVAYFWAISRFWVGSDIGFRALMLNCFLLPLPSDIIACAFGAAFAKRLTVVLKTA